MTSSSNKVYLLKGAVQQYAWGKLGSSSAVATLCGNVDPAFQIFEDQPYAELWMGAHVKAPSLIAENDQNLLDFLEANPDALGPKVKGEFGALPFLFKVLSVAKSLSIQAHPNKALAEKLHAERPDIYKDPNHKPEMAIALTQFEALCGFRPIHEIIGFLDAVPELEAVVGKPAADRLRSKASNGGDIGTTLKGCFSNVILCEKSIREENLTNLVDRIQKMRKNGQDISKFHGELLLRVHTHFPADVGCFVIYFLNHILLSPGEAIFLGANVPHAYLYGDCIECMACSDNVVRAGLTPKLVDASTLCEMLEYNPTPAEDRKFRPTELSGPNELMYNPPVKDFAVIRACVKPEHVPYKFSSLESASILLVTSGHAKGADSEIELKPGLVLFIPANATLEISSCDTEVVTYRATCLL